MRKLGPAAWPILAVALVLKLAFALGTGYELRHDARDYDRHAVSIALGEGYPDAKAPDRATAFRPPAYPVLLAAAYRASGVSRAAPAERIVVGRVLSALLATMAVALLGILAAGVWGRRVGLAAMALGAVYLPLTLVGGSVMSEALFVVLVLAAALAALAQRRSRRRYALAVLAGVLAGLCVMTRANGAVLLLPLAWAVWEGAPRPSRRALGPPVALLAAAVLVVVPWTVRNYLVFDTVVPVSTQLGSALAGTYNDQARADPDDPAAWRAVTHLPQPGIDIRGTPEDELERKLRRTALRYAAANPDYVAKVSVWNTARLLDAAGLAKARQTTSTIGISGYWADLAVPCFWLFAALALAGTLTRRARAGPVWLWALPVLLALSVVPIVVESPRYRAGIDPFVILLAALAVTAWWERRRREPSETLGPRPRERAGRS